MDVNDSFADPRARRSTQRLITLGIAVLCAIAIGFLAIVGPAPFRRANDSGLQECAMPDGTVLVLQAVTFGSDHKIEVPDPGAGLLGFLGKGSGIRKIEDRTMPNRLMLWFRRYDPVTKQALDFSWWSHCVAEDAAGNPLEDTVGGYDAYKTRRHGSSGNGGYRPFAAIPRGEYDHIFVYSSLPNLRVAGPTFKLRVYDMSNNEVAVFDVPHPHPPVAVNTWEPEPLPITKPCADVRIVLKSVSVSESGLNTPPNRPNPKLEVFTDFEILRDGQPTDTWKIDPPRIFDALGNVTENWICDLSTAESAWLLQPKLYRNDHAEFTEDEIWHINGLELPASNSSRPLNLVKTLQGVKVELTAFGRPNEEEYVKSIPKTGGSGSIGYSGPLANLFSDTDRARNPDQYLGFVIDQKEDAGVQRRKVKALFPHLAVKITGDTEDHRFGMRGRGIIAHELARTNVGDYWFLKVPADAKTIDLEILVHKAVPLEFFIKPPQLPKAGSETRP